jgi:hypothetical protein
MLPRIPFDFRVLAVMGAALGVTHLTSAIIPREALWTVSGIVIIIISIYIYVTAEHTPRPKKMNPPM